MLVATPFRTPTKHDSLLPQFGHVGCRGAPRAAPPARPRVESHERQDARARNGKETTTEGSSPPKRGGDIIMDTKYACGARQQSTPSLQALAGVRVVASLLGNSRGEKTAVFSCINAGDQLGSPPCITEGADQTQGNTPQPGMRGTEERRTLGQEWRGTNIRRGICRGWRGLNKDIKDGKTTCGARIQITPPLQALVGVRVVASLLGHSRIDALCSRANTQVGQQGLDMGNLARRPGQDHPGLVERTHHERGTRGWDRSDPCKEHETVPGLDEDPVGPHHWVASGLVGYKHGMRDGMRGQNQEKCVARAAPQPLENGKPRDPGIGPVTR